MSIKKAKTFLKGKLKKTGEKSTLKVQDKEIILNNEEFELLSLINGNRNLQDLANLAKKKLSGILKNIIKLEKLGVIELRLLREAKICKERPATSNIIAYEKEWGIYPSVLDFLDKNSENYKLKNFERELYFNIIRPFLDKVPKGSNIIDIGGGIGRFAIEFSKMGYETQVVDSSEIALKKALKHFQDENLVNFDLHLGDAADLSMFSDNRFDAAFAIELICYSDKPDKVVKELVRVTKKNGLIIISVEGKYGGILSDNNVYFEKLSTILQDGLLYIKNHLYVNYYTPASLKRLLEKCGIKVIGIFGSHYVTDGVFHRLIDVEKLDDKSYKRDVLKIEKLCQKDLALKNFARAWVAVGKKR